MIAERGPVMERAANRLLEISEDEHTRHRLKSYRRFEMDQRVNLKAAQAEGMEKIISLIEKGVPLDEIKKKLSEKTAAGDT